MLGNGKVIGNLCDHSFDAGHNVATYTTTVLVGSAKYGPAW